MIFLQSKPATSRRVQPHLPLLFFLLILAISQIVTAQDNDAAATTDDAAATAATTGTDTSTSDSTATTDSTTSSTSISVPVVTVPPTDGAPYMQTSSTPEGAVFIAVGAVLGFLGLAVLAWRGLVAWSVNRSVRQSAMMQSSETKGLLRSSRRKKSITRSKGYSFPSVSGRGGGGAAAPPPPPPHGGNRNRNRSHRRSGSGSGSGAASQKPIYIVPRSNSGLFFSPTAESRRRDYHPSAPYPGGSYPYPPAQARHQHQHQGSQGTAPTEYLEGLFDNHAPRRPQRPPEGYNRRRY